MKAKLRPSRESRRRFAKSIAAFVAAPAALSAVRAQERPAPATSPTPQATPAPRRPSPVAEAYLAVARARFGEGLSTEELDRLKRELESSVSASERLSAVKLKNSDEPDFVFGP
jgi:hypothetical protein